MPSIPSLLDADHLAMHARFQAYRELVRSGAPAAQRRALAEEICMELTIHARLVEELVHPLLRATLGDDALVDQIEERQGSQRELLARILATPADDPLYDARVAALADAVERHGRQQREEVFGRMLAAAVDWPALERAITVRRKELRTVADALREDALASALV